MGKETKGTLGMSNRLVRSNVIYNNDDELVEKEEVSTKQLADRVATAAKALDERLRSTKNRLLEDKALEEGELSFGSDINSLLKAAFTYINTAGQRLSDINNYVLGSDT